MAEPVLITAPVALPLTLAQARRHLRLPSDQTQEDEDLTSWIKAATQEAEHELGRRLITQTWDILFDGFPEGTEAIELHPDVAKVQSVEQITYRDAAGTQQTVPSASYSIDAQTHPGYVFLNDGHTWPADAVVSANSVRVRVVVGYGDPASVPDSVLSWMKLRIGLLYRFRDPLIVGTVVAEVPTHFTQSLLWPHRLRHGMP